MPPGARAASRDAAQDGRRVLHLARRRDSATCSGADADVFRARFGVLPDGNAPFDPQGEFTDKNLLYTARPLDGCRRRPPAGRRDEVEDALARARGAAARRRVDAAAAASRRQGADGVERADDRGLRARRAHAGRRATAYLDDARRAARFVRDAPLGRRRRGRCCGAIARAMPASTAMPRTTRI